MGFDEQKKKYLEALYKPDNSKKGSVDEEISYLIDKINSLDDYFTTSSCAGRIVLIAIPKSGRKDEAQWLFVSHKKIKVKDLPKQITSKELVWFRQESVILHVCCKSLESAQELVNKAHMAGFKRSGIRSTKKRYMTELTSTENMDAPFAINKKILVSKDYIKTLVKAANDKLSKTRDKAKKLHTLL